MTLVFDNESKEIIEKHAELSVKMRDRIRLLNNSSDEKFMKNKLNSNYVLPLDKTLNLHNMTVVVRSVS